MKQTLFFFLLILGTFSLFAQEDEATESVDEAQSEASLPPLKEYAVFLGIGPTVLVNTDDSTKSAPSPVSFSGGVGATLFRNAPVSFEPRLTFFTNYYLWDGEAAHPAEVENRTATVLSFLLDFDAVKIFRYKKNLFQVGGGVSLLARLAVLSGGVNSDDAGGTDASTAGDDVSSISNYVWSDLRFLYPNATFCWLYELPNGWYAGASATVYVPLGSLMNGDGADGLIASLAFRVVF